jgi:hypothetical protein
MAQRQSRFAGRPTTHLKICEAHGSRFDAAEIQVSDRESAKIWIIHNQFGRRNITPYQRCELALKLEPLYADRAKANLATAKPGTRGGSPLTTLSNAFVSKNTRKEIAKQARVAEGTIAKAKVIAAKAPEAVKQKLRKGESTINKEFKAIRNAERQKQQVERVRKFESEPPPDGKFQVAILDPPWGYTKRTGDPTHRGASPYPSMTTDQVV